MPPRHDFSPDLSEFHLVRSDILDAFAQVEALVVQFIQNQGGAIGCSTRPLGQKLETLASLSAGPKYSKVDKQLVARAIEKFSPTLSVRADVVHSSMHIVDCNGLVAIYANASALNSPFPIARMLTIEQHRVLVAEAKNFLSILTAMLTPPSPPRPLPGAASGP